MDSTANFYGIFWTQTFLNIYLVTNICGNPKRNIIETVLATVMFKIEWS